MATPACADPRRVIAAARPRRLAAIDRELRQVGSAAGGLRALPQAPDDGHQPARLELDERRGPRRPAVGHFDRKSMAPCHQADDVLLGAMDFGLKSVSRVRTRRRGRRPIPGGEQILTKVEHGVPGRGQLAARREYPSPAAMVRPPEHPDPSAIHCDRRKVGAGPPFGSQGCRRWPAGVATFGGSERFVASEWPLRR